MRASCPKTRHCVEMAYGSEPVAYEGGGSALTCYELCNSCAAFLVSLETCSCVEI